MTSLRHGLFHVNQGYNLPTTITYDTKNVEGLLNKFQALCHLRLKTWFLKTSARKFSNSDFFLKISLPLKEDELVKSEMEKNGGSPTLFWREHARKNPQWLQVPKYCNFSIKALMKKDVTKQV